MPRTRGAVIDLSMAAGPGPGAGSSHGTTRRSAGSDGLRVTRAWTTTDDAARGSRLHPRGNQASRASVAPGAGDGLRLAGASSTRGNRKGPVGTQNGTSRPVLVA